MNNSSEQSFSAGYRGLMTALFAGIANVLVSLFFNIAYRTYGSDFSNDLINVSYIIFGGMALFLVIGLIFVGLHLIFKKADLIFIIGLAAITILLFVAISSGHFSASPEENLRFRGMLHGLTIIMGISSVIGIPYLYHNEAFHRNVV
jgi:hypothetical protein